MNARSLSNALFQSRAHYMMSDIYLPVIVYCGMDGCDHATTCVYLPYEDKTTEVCVWNRIFIDSSGVSFNDCLKDFSDFSAVETTAFFNYQTVLQHTQMKNDIELHDIFFMKNIQKKHGTCSNWSLILAMILVINYNYLQDKLHRSPTFLTQWANHISAQSGAHMERLIFIFVSMRKLFYKHFLSVVKRLQNSNISDPNSLLVHYISNILFFESDVKGNEKEKDEFLRRVKNLIQGIIVHVEQIFNFKQSQKRTGKHSPSRSTPTVSKRHRSVE